MQTGSLGRQSLIISSLAHHCGRPDQQVLCLAQRGVCQFAFFDRCGVQRCHKEAVQFFCVAALDQRKHLPLKVIGAVLLALVFPGLVYSFRIMPSDQLLVSGIGDAKGLRYAKLLTGEGIM